MAKKQKSGLYRSKVKIGVDADGKDVVKYISGKTKRELEQARKEVEDYYINGTGVAADRLFGEYAQEWYDTRKAPNLSASSQQSYRTALNKDILPIFGGRNMRAIRPTELQAFVNGFAGASQTKIAVIFATLASIFTYACIDHILDYNPTSHLLKPTATPPCEKYVLSVDERARIEDVCRTHQFGPYLAAMYYLGVRPGEARGLQWGDFDWTNDLAHIQRDIDYKAGGQVGPLKTAASNRQIPVPAPLRSLLYPMRGLPGAFLFGGNTNEKPLAKTSADRIWVHLMRACQMVKPIDPADSCYRASDIRAQFAPIITPHVLRHNFITMCWENGIDVYTTMRIVGHTNYQTTMDTYTHLTNAQMDRASSQISAMFENKSCTKVAQTHSGDSGRK